MGRSQPAGETRMETTSHTNEGNWKRKGVCKVGMEWKEGHPLCHLSNSLATHSPSSQLFSHHIVMTVHLPHWFMRHKSWDQGFIVSSPLPSYPTWWVPVWNAFASLQPALCHSQNWICFILSWASKRRVWSHDQELMPFAHMNLPRGDGRSGTPTLHSSIHSSCQDKCYIPLKHQCSLSLGNPWNKEEGETQRARMGALACYCFKGGLSIGQGCQVGRSLSQTDLSLFLSLSPQSPLS
jgi:hypothetical protein